MSRQGTSDLYLSPDQQDLLVAALNSNHPSESASRHRSDSQDLQYTPNMSSNPASGQLDYSGDESPYLDFDPEGEFDDSFDYDNNGRMIGDLPDGLPGDLHDKRKSMDGKDEYDEGGGKRREGEDKVSKKPGRKPLMSEPTSKRKAQNRAAQRAFRERKERHLSDLETKVEGLEKESEATNHENGLLKAQVERLQVELKEYRKRLSWISTNGTARTQNSSFGTQAKNNSAGNNNDFNFEFPKFGDLPPMPATNLFNNGIAQKAQTTNTAKPTQASNGMRQATQTSASGSNSQSQPQRQTSQSQSPLNNSITASPQPMAQQKQHTGSVDSLTGLFSPSILEATRHSSLGSYFPHNNNQNGTNGINSNSSISNTDSPGSSSESNHNAISSIGTSPEPSLNSPSNKLQDMGLNTINEENQVSSFGFGNTSGFDSTNMNWLSQQSTNGTFDPVLFGDYRETQDNILNQDFGSFFNDAYPLPDLGSPLHNYNDYVAPDQVIAPTKPDLLAQVQAAKEGHDEVVPATDRPMTCNKIWDRLQSMEKFRNGEIDIDNLCSELRAKAKCSEGGAVVDKRDVDKILGHGK